MEDVPQWCTFARCLERIADCKSPLTDAFHTLSTHTGVPEIASAATASLTGQFTPTHTPEDSLYTGPAEATAMTCLAYLSARCNATPCVPSLLCAMRRWHQVGDHQTAFFALAALAARAPVGGTHASDHDAQVIRDIMATDTRPCTAYAGVFALHRLFKDSPCAADATLTRTFWQHLQPFVAMATGTRDVDRRAMFLAAVAIMLPHISRALVADDHVSATGETEVVVRIVRDVLGCIATIRPGLCTVPFEQAVATLITAAGRALPGFVELAIIHCHIEAHATSSTVLLEAWVALLNPRKKLSYGCPQWKILQTAASMEADTHLTAAITASTNKALASHTSDAVISKAVSVLLYLCHIDNTVFLRVATNTALASVLSALGAPTSEWTMCREVLRRFPVTATSIGVTARATRVDMSAFCAIPATHAKAEWSCCCCLTTGKEDIDRFNLLQTASCDTGDVTVHHDPLWQAWTILRCTDHMHLECLRSHVAASGRTCPACRTPLMEPWASVCVLP
jgi:hypothetical protein